MKRKKVLPTRTPRSTGKRASRAVDDRATPGDDPRFAAVVDAFSADPALAAVAAEYVRRKKVDPGRKFGSNGLKVKGRLFAMVVRGRLVVKLPRERVDGMVAAGTGERFETGPGRVMKEWVVAGAVPSWIDLAREAHDFVKSSP